MGDNSALVTSFIAHLAVGCSKSFCLTKAFSALPAFNLVSFFVLTLYVAADIILGAFASYAPKIYEHYASTFKSLYNHHPGLQHNFRNSVFPAITFNLGPDTVTLDHEDVGNLPFGMCALTSAGPYDPKKGGHLILFQFRVVIEFPPGATIILPSATIRHANTAIQPGESRMSIAQYAAGGLFRWNAYGFQSARSLLSKPGGKAEKSRINGAGEVRWQQGLGMFSKFEQLSHDRQSVFAQDQSVVA